MMTAPPYDSLERTQGHLKILGSIYIVMGIIALPIAILVHLMFYFFVDSNAINTGDYKLDQAFVQMIFTMKWGLWILTVVHILFHILLGFYFMRYKHYWACNTAGILYLLNFPFGTLLGVFTLIVLARPEAKYLYGMPSKTNYPPIEALKEPQMNTDEQR